MDGHLPGDLRRPYEAASSIRHAIVVVDTCRLFREGLSNILRASSFDVVVAAANIQDALAEIDHAGDATIDMLICSLDPQRAIEAQLASIKAVRRRDPATKTVLLMPTCSVEDLVAAVLCGVDGVILKDISGEKLISVLDLVMHGQHVLPLGVSLEIFARLRPAGDEAAARIEQEGLGDAVSSAIVATAPATRVAYPATTTAPYSPATTAARPFATNLGYPSAFGAADAAGLRERTSAQPTRSLGLSERETQILQCLVEGCANKLIARRLDIAEATVKVHIKGLLRKINVSNRTQAAIWALNQSVSAGQVRGDAAPPASTAPSAAAVEPSLSEMVAVFPTVSATPTPFA